MLQAKLQYDNVISSDMMNCYVYNEEIDKNMSKKMTLEML